VETCLAPNTFAGAAKENKESQLQGKAGDEVANGSPELPQPTQVVGLEKSHCGRRCRSTRVSVSSLPSAHLLSTARGSLSASTSCAKRFGALCDLRRAS
jgi:hypothetical protein